MNENNYYTKRSGVLDLPEVEAWDAAVNGAELLDGLSGLLRRHVVLPLWVPETLALWVVHTYAFHLRNVTTYVGVVSPEKRCGKTTLLTLLGKLANRSLVAANISPPAMFRVIERVHPTLLIDEADTFLQGKEELRGILNAGCNQESAYVVRIDPAEAGSIYDGLRKYSCWCPKVIAAIGELPETLADRCIVVTMQRKRSGEVCERLRKLNGEEWRRKCARFVADNAAAIEAAEPSVPEGLNDRAVDIWEPLLALADIAGGIWPELAREAATGLSGGKEDVCQCGLLLRHIQVVFTMMETDKLFSRTLVDYLMKMKNPPWAGLLKGKVLTDVWLAQQLRRVGVTPRTVWIDGATARGYVVADFADAFARYATTGEGSKSQSASTPPTSSKEAPG
jgi:hypothetical protein